MEEANAIPKHIQERFDRSERLWLDRFRGCLVGGAAGDALGYVVEFSSWGEIRAKYGRDGISAYEPDPESGLALVSDDTQMALFTAAAVLIGDTRQALRGISGDVAGYAGYTYRDWLFTQDGTFGEARGETWLSEVPGLYARRAPGMTCMGAIRAGCDGAPDRPINNSKGCGGIMRVAPIGLYFEDPREAARQAAGAAALTHGHPLGFIPAAVLAHAVSALSHGEPPRAGFERDALERALEGAMAEAGRKFPEHGRDVDYLDGLLSRAAVLARNGSGDPQRDIASLGEGWVGEEALAIAAYAALSHPGDFGAAIRTAVNHSGDSDSTGAVCGNIVGAMLGLSAIGPEWTEGLELRDVVLEVADDLCRKCPMEEREPYRDERWLSKYGTGGKLMRRRI